MSYLAKLSFILLLLGGLIGIEGGDTVQGQDWLRTVEVRIPVTDDLPTRTLVDTIESYLVRNPSMQVRRVPDSMEVPFSDLQNLLLDEGLSVSGSASHAFLQYRLSQDRNGNFHQDILSLGLYFSPQGEAEEDTPLLFASSTDAWFQTVLNQKGTPLPTNQAAIQLFRDKLGIGKVLRLDDAEIAAFGGETLRDQRTERKRQLRERIIRMTY